MKRRTITHHLAVAVVSALALPALFTACTAKSSGAAVKVTSTNDSCELSSATVTSGSTTFEVTNSGGDVTEVYVYADGTRIMGEVENIGPGSSRSFTADLGAGDYEVACKPGQKGDGIRTPLVVTGATTTTAAPSRTIAITAAEWGYTGFEHFVGKEGETIEFTLTNNGTIEHEMEILDPDGEAVGEVGPTKPGATGSVVVTLYEQGEWEVECGIAGHLEHGMRHSFTVTAKSAGSFGQ